MLIQHNYNAYLSIKPKAVFTPKELMIYLICLSDHLGHGIGVVWVPRGKQWDGAKGQSVLGYWTTVTHCTTRRGEIRAERT